MRVRLQLKIISLRRSRCCCGQQNVGLRCCKKRTFANTARLRLWRFSDAAMPIKLWATDGFLPNRLASHALKVALFSWVTYDKQMWNVETFSSSHAAKLRPISTKIHLVIYIRNSGHGIFQTLTFRIICIINPYFLRILTYVFTVLLCKWPSIQSTVSHEPCNLFAILG